MRIARVQDAKVCNLQFSLSASCNRASSCVAATQKVVQKAVRTTCDHRDDELYFSVFLAVRLAVQRSSTDAPL